MLVEFVRFRAKQRRSSAQHRPQLSRFRPNLAEVGSNIWARVARIARSSTVFGPCLRVVLGVFGASFQRPARGGRPATGRAESICGSTWPEEDEFVLYTQPRRRGGRPRPVDASKTGPLPDEASPPSQRPNSPPSADDCRQPFGPRPLCRPAPSPSPCLQRRHLAHVIAPRSTTGCWQREQNRADLLGVLSPPPTPLRDNCWTRLGSTLGMRSTAQSHPAAGK